MPDSEAAEICSTSGNDFHFRVVKYLREVGWSVLVGPYYSDGYTQLPREIDIVAEKDFKVTDFMGKHPGDLRIRLLIECKYIANTTVFWFDQKDEGAALRRVMTDTNLGDPRENTQTNNHHYLGDSKVAKVFETKKKAQENDPIYRALNQSLGALTYWKGGHDTLFPSKESCKVLNTIYYPVVACSSFSKFYSKDVTDDGDEIQKITDNFQLEVKYAYNDHDGRKSNDYFLIDFIEYAQLQKFLEQIDVDVHAMKDKHSWSSIRG